MTHVSHHSLCDVVDKGQLYTFGDGRHGKLALGAESFTNQFRPFRVPRFSKFKVTKVRHLLNLTAIHSVWVVLPDRLHIICNQDNIPTNAFIFPICVSQMAVLTSS